MSVHTQIKSYLDLVVGDDGSHSTKYMYTKENFVKIYKIVLPPLKNGP